MLAEGTAHKKGQGTGVVFGSMDGGAGLVEREAGQTCVWARGEGPCLVFLWAHVALLVRQLKA